MGRQRAPHPDCRSVQARIVDASRSREVKEALGAASRADFVSWEDKNQTLLAAVRSEKAMIVIILFFIIGIAAGSILGILYMMVIEKTRDIGILRSMGLSGRRVVAVFVGCGAILGLIGSSAGLALGLPSSRTSTRSRRGSRAGRSTSRCSTRRSTGSSDIPTKLVPEWVLGTVARRARARGPRGRDPGRDRRPARSGQVPQG